jgi:hypothetical protein
LKKVERREVCGMGGEINIDKKYLLRKLKGINKLQEISTKRN